MKIISVRLDANVQTPAGPGQHITSAHVDDGFTIEQEGALYFIANPKMWGEKFIQVPTNRTLGAICETEPAKGRKP